MARAFGRWQKAIVKAQSRDDGYHSGLEAAVAKQLEELGVKFEFEAYRLRYTVPARTGSYETDFVLPNGIIVETKGRFTSKDRQKHKQIREQFPELDIRIVFSNPNTKIGKKSKTTYAMWCDRLGIPYAAKTVPVEWAKEPASVPRIAAMKKHLIKREKEAD